MSFARILANTAIINIEAKRGTDIEVNLNWYLKDPNTLARTLQDFTGYIPNAGIRVKKEDASDLLPLSVTVGGVSPNLKIVIPRADMSTLNYQNYYYYITLDSTIDKRRRFIEGMLRVS